MKERLNDMRDHLIAFFMYRSHNGLGSPGTYDIITSSVEAVSPTDELRWARQNVTNTCMQE